MKQTVLWLVFIAVCVLQGLSGALMAQDESANLKFITTENGLSENFVTAILRDQKGFMWFGTTRGLNRYDGHGFKVFYADPSTEDSLSGNFIRSLFQDENGYIWVGTEGRGINIYDPELEIFEHYKKEEGGKNTLPDNTILSIMEDHTGRVWLGTKKGICYWLPEEKAFKQMELPLDSPRIGTKVINCMHEDDTRKIWLGTDAGLYRWDPATDKLDVYLQDEESKGALPDDQVQSFYESPSGLLYVGTRRGLGIMALPYYQRRAGESGGDARWLALDFVLNEETQSDIQIIKGDRKGNIWIGTFGGGLINYREENGRMTEYRHSRNDPNSLSSDDILSIELDPSGMVWVGTYEGLNAMDLTRIQFNTVLPNIISPDGLPSNDVFTATEDNFGGQWIGNDHGLLRRNKKTGETFTWTPSGTEEVDYLDPSVYATLVDGKGTLWVGTSQFGLFYVTEEELREETYRFHRLNEKNPAFELPGDEILCLFEDREKRLWVGTSDGMVILDWEADSLLLYESDYEDTSTLSDNTIQCVYQDVNGVYWVGTANGLNQYLPEKGTFQRYLAEENKETNSLQSSSIYALYEDTKGYLWIGTDGGGISRIDPTRESWETFTTLDGVPDDVVYAILEDEEGNLWISTNAGLCRIKLSESVETPGFIIYNQKDNGLISNTFNIGAAYLNQLGFLFFGSSEGLVYFHLDYLLENDVPPPVVVTDFQLFFEEVLVDPNGDSPLKKSIIETRRIELNSSQNVLYFEFAALNYVQSEENEYAYMLENADQDWNYIQDKRNATFTYLDPGRYIFRVKAANNDGIWNEEGVAVEVIIHPPFYETIYFYLIIVGLIVLGIVGYIRLRVRNLEQNKTRLENMVQDRTEELSQKTHALEKALVTLKSAQTKLVESEKMASLGQLTAGVAHEINNPITFVIGNVGPLKRDITDVLEVLQQYDKTIQSHKLQSYFQQVEETKEELDFSYILEEISALLQGIEEGANRTSTIVKGLRNFSRLDEEEIKNASVHEGLDSTLLILNSQLKNRIEVIKDYGDIPEILCFPGKLNQVYMNIMSNAMQAIDEEGRVYLKTWSKEGSVFISIKDTGVGMTEEVKQRIFEPFFTTKDVGEGTGLGLSISFGIIEQHQGNIIVNSEIGNGTEFLISLPITGPK
ncbi:MAG: two-component regulator propeller domain-containing protein [Bacteroidota bacterium]